MLFLENKLSVDNRKLTKISEMTDRKLHKICRKAQVPTPAEGIFQEVLRIFREDMRDTEKHHQSSCSGIYLIFFISQKNSKLQLTSSRTKAFRNKISALEKFPTQMHMLAS